MPELAQIETVVFLQSAELFSSCKAEEILRVASIAQERQVAAGEKIFSLNEPADTFYSLVRGTVHHKGDGWDEHLGPLTSFGGVDLLRGRLRTTSAVAETDCLLLAFDDEDFLDLLSHNIDIVKAIFRHLFEQQLPKMRQASASADTPTSEA